MGNGSKRGYKPLRARPESVAPCCYGLAALLALSQAIAAVASEAGPFATPAVTLF